MVSNQHIKPELITYEKYMQMPNKTTPSYFTDKLNQNDTAHIKYTIFFLPTLL